MGDVVRLDAPWYRELDPDTLLEANKGGFPEVAIIVGIDAAGEVQIGATIADAARVHWLLSRALHRLMRGDFGHVD